MKHSRLTQLFLNQVTHQIWMIDTEFHLIYANDAYQNYMIEATGAEKNIDDLVFLKAFSEADTKKWKSYYQRALKGEFFEVEECFQHAEAEETQYKKIAFKPIYGDDKKIVAVACESIDITSDVKKRFEANKLIDASLDVFCSFDEQGNFVYVSAASEDHWGYLPEEMVGKPITDFVLEADIPKTNDIAADILEGEVTKTFVNRYRKKDGGIAYNSWSARWDPKVKIGYSVARDNFDKIKQEEFLYQSEQRFKALVQEGADLIGILDIEGNYKYVSPTSTAVLGISPDEFIGRSAFEFIHPDDAERVAESLQKLETTNRVKIDAFRFRNNENEWRWVETILTNMMDNPAVKGVVANSRDVTAIIKEEHKLKLFEKVINSTSDALLITEAKPLDDPVPRIVYVNEAFTKNTGYTAEEVIGKNPRFLQGPNTDKEKLDLLDKKIRRGESAETTVINYTKYGEEFWVNFVVNPVVDQRGILTHFTSVQRDVTVQKNKEKEKDLLAEISSNFVNKTEYIDAAKGLCRTVGEFGNLEWVELWTTNIERSQLQLISCYFRESSDNQFYKEKKSLQPFEAEKGLPGTVWAKKEQLLWTDIRNDKKFIRRESAKKVGFKSALGIPLTFQNEVIGVLLLGTKQGPEKLEKISALFEGLQDFIGSEINRKKLENDLHNLYNTIPDIVCLSNLDGKILKMNRAGYELLGHSETEMLQSFFDQYTHPEDREIYYQKLSKLKKSETSFKFENRYLTKDNSVIWLSWYCNISREEGVIYATARDITEEKKLRKLNKQANDLAKVGSWEFDLVNENLFWSEEVHQLHETNPETFVPTVDRAVGFYKEEYKEFVEESIQKSLSEGVYLDYEAVIISRSKKERWVRVIASPEFSEGKCVKFIGSFQDITERKEAESRLQSLADNLPGVAFQYVLYPNGKDELKYVTKGSEKVWGFSVEETIKNNQLVWNQIKAGGDFDHVIESIRESVTNEEDWSAKWNYVMPEGDVKKHLGYGSPRYMADGSVHFNSMILDITEQVETVKSFEQATSLARIGTWELDLRNNKVTWSNMVHELHETDPITFQPELGTALNFYREDFRNLVQEKIEYCIETGEQVEFQAVIITAENNERWVQSRGDAEFINGKCVKVYGSFQDIHNSKTLELEIREILKSITDPFQVIDANWNFKYYNKEAEQLLKKPEEYVISQNIWEVFPEKLGTPLEKIYKSVARTGKPDSIEYLFAGDNHWYEVNVYPFQGGVSTFFRNINARKLAAEKLEALNKSLKNYALELERSNEELEQFAFITSHDMQEPLRMISSFMDQLKRKYGDQLDEKALQYISFATDGAKRMKQIILDLLQYSRANRPEGEIEEVDLNEVLSKYKELRRKIISEKSVAIYSDDLPVFRTYKAVVTQIFHGLLDNAIKYSKSGIAPVIEIKVAEKEMEWLFSFNDNGIGISPQFFNKIFDIFQRLHNRDEYQGTGIGLSITKRSVEFLGGAIWLESEPGVGTTFFFTVSKTQLK